MRPGDWLTVLLIVINILAGFAFLYSRDWGKLLYFTGAAILMLGILMME